VPHFTHNSLFISKPPMVQQLEQPFHPHLVHTLMRLTMSPLRREQLGHLPPGIDSSLIAASRLLLSIIARGPSDSFATVCPAIRLTIRYCLDKQICNPVFCYTVGTHSDECDHKKIYCDECKKKKDSVVQCLSCHLSMKRKIRIRCSYRYPKKKGRPWDKSFGDLEKRLAILPGVTIEKFSSHDYVSGHDYEYQIILFEDSKEAKRPILKEIIMSEEYGFFGDRPAMYFFIYNEGIPYVGESGTSYQRLSRHLEKKEISKGGIIINTTENKYWTDDPLNST
ncbi:uncharacterized protein METZ01_LOCUS276098, partial [marine metagenome]